MHHLLAYTSSITNGAVLASLGTVTDEIFTPFSATVYTFSRPMRIVRSYAFGPNMTQVQMDSPNLRTIGPPNIQPFDTGAAPSTLPPINMPDANGLVLAPNDPLGIKISRAGAGALPCWTLLWMAAVQPQKIMGPVRRIRATCTVTSTTTGWTSGSMTLDQALPTGRYQIVGMAATGTNLFAARLILPGGDLRPGVLAQDASSEYDWPDFSYGNFGDYGSFDSWAPPTVQFMGYGANTAQTVWLDIIPRGVNNMGTDLAL